MKINLRNFAGAAAAIYTGMRQGEIQAREANEADADRDLSQSIRNFALGRDLEEDSFRREDAADDQLLSQAQLVPERDRAGIINEVNRRRAERAARPRKFGPEGLGAILPKTPEYEPFRGLLGGQGPAPAAGVGGLATPGSGAGGQGSGGRAPGTAARLELPGIGSFPLANRQDEDAYARAVRVREEQALTTRDPERRAKLLTQAQNLKAKREAGVPLDEAGEGPGGLGTYEPEGLDPKERDALQKQAMQLRKDLDRAASEISDSDPDSLKIKQQIVEYAGRIPAAVTDDRSAEAARQAIQGSGSFTMLASLATRRAGGQEDDAARKQLLDDFNAIAPGGTSGSAPLTDEAAAPLLVDALSREEAQRARTKGGRGTVQPVFSGFKGEIGEIQKLLDQAAADESKGDLEAAQAGREEAAGLARAVRSRVWRGMGRAQEAEAFKRAYQIINGMSAEEANDPEQVAKVFSAVGLDYLPGLGTLKLGGKRLEQRYDTLLKGLPGLGKLDPKSQAPHIEELTALSRALGKQITIPAEVVLQLSPEAKQRLALAQSKFNWEKQEKWPVLKAKHELEKQRLEQAVNGTGPQGAKWSPQQTAEARRLQREVDFAFREYSSVVGTGRGQINPALFDPEGFISDGVIQAGLGGQPQEIQRAVKLYQKYLAAKNQVTRFLQGGASASAGPDTTAHRLKLPSGKEVTASVAELAEGYQQAGMTAEAAREKAEKTVKQFGVKK